MKKVRVRTLRPRDYMGTLVRLRRGPSTDLPPATVDGEIVYCTDTGLLMIAQGGCWYPVANSETGELNLMDDKLLSPELMKQIDKETPKVPGRFEAIMDEINDD